MDSVIVNGQEVNFEPAPEFRFTTNLVASNGKPIKVESPNQYRSGYEFYIVGGGQFIAEEAALINAVKAILNERLKAEKASRATSQARRASEVLKAKEEKLAGMDNVEIHD